MKRFVLASLVGLMGVWTGAACYAQTRPRVTIEQGILEGRQLDGADVYRNIPYARAPEGDLRWRAPRPASRWRGVRQAGDYGPRCPQARTLLAPQSEDCLTINVAAPVDRGAELLPVMVWVHGGSFTSGSGAIDGSAFTRDGVVFVSMNYRLGRLGFFSHPAFVAERLANEPAANFGLLDQIEALRWVQRNISAFGGDPRRVTIFGVSAGGSSVNYLVASPMARGLFSGAIAQSAVNGYGLHPRLTVTFAGMPPQTAAGVAFAEREGLRGDLAAQMRALPWQRIVGEVNDLTGFGPIVDGVVIPDEPFRIFAQGQQNPVAYLAGSNSYEGSLARAIPVPETVGLGRVIAENRAEFARLHGRAVSDPEVSILAYGDLFFATTDRHLTRSVSGNGRRGFRYHFDYLIESVRDQLPGVGHGLEVMYVFDALPQSPMRFNAGQAAFFGLRAGTYPVIEADYEIARQMHGAWVQFAKTGSPNGPGLPIWPAYDERDEQTMVYGAEGARAISGYGRERHAFAERLYGEFNAAMND